eukprot:Lankesteria_metandrocarpae@DN1153_c0_g1_i1.p1
MVKVEQEFELNKESKIRTLEEYLVPMISGRVRISLEFDDTRGNYVKVRGEQKHKNPISFISNKKVTDGKSSSTSWDSNDLYDPYRIRLGPLSYYIVTIYNDDNNKNGEAFVAHEFMPYINDDGLLTGTVTLMDTAMFTKDGNYSRGVFAFKELFPNEFKNKSKVLDTHRCVVQDYIVSEDANIEIRIFRGRSIRGTPADQAKFDEHARNRKAPLLVLSKVENLRA